MKNIHNIVAHFGSLRGAKVGFGPKHPQQPDVAISEEVTTFISKFPFLQ